MLYNPIHMLYNVNLVLYIVPPLLCNRALLRSIKWCIRVLYDFGLHAKVLRVALAELGGRVSLKAAEGPRTKPRRFIYR